LSDTAPLEVNVTKKSIERVKAKMEKGEYDQELFSEITETIRTNLSDVLNRFARTKEYRAYQQNEQLAEKMLQKVGIQ
jgi:hypothetical protein